MKWVKSNRSNGTGGSNCLEAATLDDGSVMVRNSRFTGFDSPALVFTRAEWDAFLGGAKDGDFDGV